FRPAVVELRTDVAMPLPSVIAEVGANVSPAVVVPKVTDTPERRFPFVSLIVAVIADVVEPAIAVAGLASTVEVPAPTLFTSPMNATVGFVVRITVPPVDFVTVAVTVTVPAVVERIEPVVTPF